MDEVKKEADGLDTLTNNIMELGTQVNDDHNKFYFIILLFFNCGLIENRYVTLFSVLCHV